MGKYRVKTTTKRGRSLGLDLYGETGSTSLQVDTKDNIKYYSLSMQEYQKNLVNTPKRNKGKKPTHPRFIPKKKTFYKNEDNSSSDEEGGDDKNKKDSYNDTSDSWEGRDNPNYRSEGNSDSKDEEQLTNPDEAYSFFVAICNLVSVIITALNGMGYHTTGDIESFG